jgi:8-oxo-dGTP diphosphatase
VAVGIIIRLDDRIALVRRDKEPSRGLWTFPGGAVELGEEVREAARREAWEETGLHVEIGEVLTVVDNVVHDQAGRVHFHYVIIDFLARPVGGSLQPGTDANEARWATRADLDALDMTEKAYQVAIQLLSKP